MRKPLTLLALVLASGLAAAQATPAGLWKTIDDDGKTEKSLVRVTDNGGMYSARIEKVVNPAKQTAVCDKCSDERKGQPLVGLNIIRNVKAAEGESNLWDGGDILDPEDGKVYKVRLKLADGGKKLDVRAYIGAPILGRTQTWIRME